MALVAVFGASGRHGLAQVRQLKKAGHEVRAISRRADPFLGEDFGSVEVTPADIYDEDSVVAAMAGADAAFYTHPLRARVDRVQGVATIGRAAKRANLKRVVWNTSSWIPDKAGDPFTYGGNTQGINALWRTGAPATVFGSVLFMDNLLTNWAFPFIVAEGRYVYPHKPDLECSWISLDDVAKFMIAAIDRPDLEGAWLNIGGPETLKPPEVADLLSRAVGRSGTLRSQHPGPVRQAPRRRLRRHGRRRTRGDRTLDRGVLRITTTTARPSRSRSTWRRFWSAYRSSWRPWRNGRRDRTGA